MADYNDFKECKDYDEWLEVNGDLISEMLQGYETYEVLYAAWFAGYCNGMDAMGNMFPNIFGRPKIVDEHPETTTLNTDADGESA